MIRRPLTRLLIGTVVVAPLSFSVGCRSHEHQSPRPPEVAVEQPVQRDVTEYLEESGQLTATHSVDLVARVQGYLEAIGYSDGAFVRKGTLLFTIEPAPYQAQFEQAKANLASTLARAQFNELQYKRYSDLDRTDSTSRQQAEQIHSDHDSSEAEVLQAQATLTQAQITYGYTRVSAPFDGEVTAHQVDVGELVGNGQATQLATIVQVDPIWVNFNISEQDVLRIDSSLSGHAVEIGLQDEAGYPHRGHIDYAAPLVDSGTGTLAARGLFDNPSHILRPGYFVRIRIPVGSVKGALLVPNDAVGNDQGDRTVLVVTTGDVVEARRVRLGARDGEFQVIESGLGPNDRVIVNGLQQVRVGQKVVPREVRP